jgi:enamine deaminase RidA (YjgF/YER057c/UK114 family)
MDVATERLRIGSGAPWEHEVGYSRAVRVGERVLVAGTTAVVDGEPAYPGDAYGQTRLILEIIERALGEAGAQMRDVVRTRIFTTDIARWREIGRAHGEVFSGVMPAVTMVQVAALIDPRLLVEIEAEAILD